MGESEALEFHLDAKERIVVVDIDSFRKNLTLDIIDILIKRLSQFGRYQEGLNSLVKGGILEIKGKGNVTKTKEEIKETLKEHRKWVEDNKKMIRWLVNEKKHLQGDNNETKR